MTENDHVPGPSELVYTPRPSWAPAFFAVGLSLAICGIFSKFLVSSWVYALIGLVVLVVAVGTLVSDVVRNFFRFPRHQRVRGAVLPASSLHVARREPES